MPWDLYPEARSWLDIAVAVVAAVVMPAVSALRRKRLAEWGERPLNPLYRAAILRGLGFAAVILGIWLVQGRSLTALGLGLPGTGAWVVLGALAVLAIAAFAQLRLIPTLTPERIAQAKQSIAAQKILPRTEGEYRTFVALSFSAGFWEELAYRGFLVWFLAAWLDGIGAVVASAVIFGLGHAYQGIGGILRTAGLGLVFGGVYLLCANLWPLIVAHAAIDLFGGSVARAVHRTVETRALTAAPAAG